MNAKILSQSQFELIAYIIISMITQQLTEELSSRDSTLISNSSMSLDAVTLSPLFFILGAFRNRIFVLGDGVPKSAFSSLFFPKRGGIGSDGRVQNGKVESHCFSKW